LQEKIGEFAEKKLNGMVDDDDAGVSWYDLWFITQIGFCRFCLSPSRRVSVMLPSSC
jgi:hypothetical protein